MKKLLYLLLLNGALLAGGSCSKGVDNYPAPGETLTGIITDSSTGKPIQTEVGSGGATIVLEELSWSPSPTPFKFYGMEDGTYNNTKIFKGHFRISVEGPWVPLVQRDNAGNITVDRRQTMDISGVTHANFTVEPFFKVEWVGDPVLNADGSITANFKFTRGTNNPSFQANATNITLFVNSSKYVGNFNFDGRYSNKKDYNSSTGTALIGQTISTTTIGGTLPKGLTYYLRVGVRNSSGQNLFNYNEPKAVSIP